MKNGVVVVTIFFIFIGLGTGNIVPELVEELEKLDDDELIPVLVQVQPGTNSTNITLSEDTETVEDFDSFDIVFLELPAGDVENLSAEDTVLRVEPDYEVEAMLLDSTGKIGARSVHATGVSGDGVRVAVLDSGIETHRRLSIVQHRDFTGEGNGDLSGHGTHVAGIIASTHPEYRGIAPGIDLYDVKVLDGNGSGSGVQLLQGLDYVVRNDIDVAVLSLGSITDRCSGQDALSRSANVAMRSGVTVVVAAGNEGPDDQTLSAPGCAEHPITVGAVDGRDRIASYSSRGYTADGRTKPDVVAPGTNIISTSRTGNFVAKSGTSMATPHVAGQVALLLEQYPDRTPKQVKSQITASSTDLGYPSRFQGSGRIDVPASMNMSVAQHSGYGTSLFQRFWLWLTALFA